MSHSQNILSPDIVLELARPIVMDKLRQFRPDEIDIREDIDFDGEPIIRMNVKTGEAVTARAISAATDALRVELLERNDLRYVFLHAATAEDFLGRDEDEE